MKFFPDEDFPPLSIGQRKVQAAIMLVVLMVIMPILCGTIAWLAITLVEKNIEINQLKQQINSK